MSTKLGSLSIVYVQLGPQKLYVMLSSGVSAMDLYPLLRNYDVWGEIVGINWNTMACEWRDYFCSSSCFLRVSAVFHSLFFCEVSSVVFLSSGIVSRSDDN